VYLLSGILLLLVRTYLCMTVTTLSRVYLPTAPAHVYSTQSCWQQPPRPVAPQAFNQAEGLAADSSGRQWGAQYGGPAAPAAAAGGGLCLAAGIALLCSAAGNHRVLQAYMLHFSSGCKCCDGRTSHLYVEVSEGVGGAPKLVHFSGVLLELMAVNSPLLQPCA